LYQLQHDAVAEKPLGFEWGDETLNTALEAEFTLSGLT
jgi:hypothetical protein